MADKTVSVKLDALVSNYIGQMAAATGATKGFGSVLGAVGKGGISTLGAIGIAGAAVGAIGIKMAMDWETAFAGVRKTVDATEAEFAVLERGIRDMALEVPVAATEIAGVAEAAGQLGIATEDILGFTRVMVDLGVTTNMTAQDAATQLARMANITGMSSDNFDRLGATVVDLGNNLATTEGEIVAMGLRIAGAGAQVGLAEHDILALAGALSSVGVEAQAGGTSISRVMIDMANSVAEGGAKLEELAEVAGMTSEQFATLFQEDAAGAILALVQGLDRISESGGNVFATLEKLGFSEIRVRDAMLRLAGASEVLEGALGRGSTAWQQNTALTDEAGKRYETTASQVTMFINRLKDIAIDLGEALMPVVDVLLEIGETAADVAGFVIDLTEHIGGLGFAFKALLLYINPVTRALVIFNELAKGFEWEPPEFSQEFTDTIDAINQFRDSNRDAAGASGDFEDAIGGVGEAIGGAADAAGGATGPVDDLAEGLGDAYKNARDLYNAMLQLAGGFLSVAGAAFSLEDAQADLAEAQKRVSNLAERGRRGTKAWAEATRDLERAELKVIESQLGLTGSVQDFVKEQREAGLSTKEIIAQVRQQGREAGLTGKQISGLVGRVKELIAENKKVPGDVKTRYTGEGLPGEIADVTRLTTLVNALDGRLIRYTVVGTLGSVPGTGQRVGGHAGGTVGSSLGTHYGGLRSDERLIVGQTGERMLSRSAMQTMRRILGEPPAPGGGDGGGGDINVIVNGDVYDGRRFEERVMSAVGKAVQRGRSL